MRRCVVRARTRWWSWIFRATRSADWRWASRTRALARWRASRRRGLPAERPRYLMGVGKPEQIPDYVALGVDMMDCVLPTRSARHGCLYTSQGRMLIKNAQYANDPRPIDETCECAVCRRYSRAYLRHLVNERRISRDHFEHPPQHPLLP